MVCTSTKEHCFSCSYLEISLPHLDLPMWLAKQPLYPKFYWKEKNSDVERAALGSLAHIDAIPDFDHLPSHVRLFGAHFFSEKASSDPVWKDFPSLRFFLPEFEIEQTKQHTKLILRSLHASPNEALLEKLIFSEDSSSEESPRCVSRQDIPSQSKWNENVRTCLNLIGEDKLLKVVLARQTVFQFEEKLDAYSILKKLKEKSQHATVFAYQISPSAIFLGASPETLYRRQDVQLTTEAIAGTRKRGGSSIEDALLKQDLLTNQKEGNEFNIVKDFIAEKLSTLCSNFSFSHENSIIQTATVQHLYNRFDGDLFPSVSDSMLLSSLHPTPAMGGAPRMLALDLIEKLEPFERGLYASPIGWITSQESSFAVGIRSAVITRNQMHVFAGTGIVQGSDPDKEWEELEYKIAQWELS